MDAERINQLDGCWSIYKQWLADCDQRLHDHRRQLTFPEWMHTQYEAARKGVQA